ncbi:hypothetical protein [Kordia sp.]|uniref:hypothetical protein n=1 Tax=Kordia sp. TaxID=1965332 RepID=UPI003B58DFCE
MNIRYFSAYILTTQSELKPLTQNTMKLKTTLFILFFLAIGFSHAQKIKIKKGIVYLDEVAILKSDARKTTHSLYDLDGNEILFIRFSVRSQLSDLQHNEFKFLKQRITVETTDYDYTSLSYKQTIINIIEWLLQEKVLTTNGKINPGKIELFHYKYDEAISEKIGITKTSCNCDCDNED